MASTAFRCLFCHYLDICLFSRSSRISLIFLQQSSFKLSNCLTLVWIFGSNFAFACVGGCQVRCQSSLAVTRAQGCCSRARVNELVCYTAVHCLPSLPCWCEAADHHVGHMLLQSYKSPTVRLGPNGTATAGNGQAHQGGRGWLERGGVHLCP